MENTNKLTTPSRLDQYEEAAANGTLADLTRDMPSAREQIIFAEILRVLGIKEARDA